MYTRKQNQVMRRARSKDWFLMINHGGVRAGKTVLNNDLFLMELRRVRKKADELGIAKPIYILAAYSSSTLKTNILNELENKYGLTFKFDKSNNFFLFGVYVVTTFTASISGLGAIRGMTSFGAYINEASLANKEVFGEIINRCSGDGARILCDTNPDHPKHWLKVDYIDKADGENIVANHFTVLDNNFLTKRYIDNLIATTPSGTMTERAIYGRWTIGEGAIYKDFDHNKHVISREKIPKSDTLKIVCGVDWGFEHNGVISVIGIDMDDFIEVEGFKFYKHYLIEEHVHKHWHINQWIDLARDIANRYGHRIPFYCDSARPEYVDAFYNARLNARNADKAVIPGISEVGTLIKLGLFLVSDTCQDYITEIGQYVWNKTGDAPLKENDDTQDAVRYGVYTDKIIRIGGFN